MPSSAPTSSDVDLAGFERASPRARLGVAAAVVLVIAALAGTVLWGIVRQGGQGAAELVPANPGQSGAAVVAGGEVFVHVGGAVRAPGLYRLPADARVVDAIAAALGFAEGAEREAVNLARPLVDGEQLIVPLVAADGAGSGSGGAGAGAAGDSKLDLNRATTAELEELPRIGEALAGRIIAWREEHGRFTSVDDLAGVSGIGEKMLETLRPLVRV